MGRARTAGRLRISHVVGTGNFAGLERYVVEVSNALAARGHDVQVVGGGRERMQELLSGEVTWSGGATPREALRSLASAGRRDIVHSHISKADYVALAAAPLTGGRRVSTRHIVDRRGYGRWARWAAPLVRRGLAGEIAISRWLADRVETRPDIVIVNGVRSVPDHEEPREQTVVIAQRLAPEKDTAVGLQAWALSGLADDGWSMVVAGEGTERAALESKVVELGVSSSVELVGWVADVDPVFARAGILLAPAPTEPFGLTVLEAMAHGLPVVATGSAGHLETVGRCRGARLFAPGDAHGASVLLRDLAADLPARAAYGEGLRQVQREQLDLDLHVDELEEYYRALSGPLQPVTTSATSSPDRAPDDVDEVEATCRSPR